MKPIHQLQFHAASFVTSEIQRRFCNGSFYIGVDDDKLRDIRLCSFSLLSEQEIDRHQILNALIGNLQSDYRCVGVKDSSRRNRWLP